MADKKVNAVILAGTHADKSKLIQGRNKSFLEINGQPIVLNSLQALQNAESIADIGIVGPRQDLETVTSDSTVKIVDESLGPKESRRFIENALNGYHAVSPNGERTLYITSDLPFIVPQTIDDFVAQTEKYQASLNFGMINTDNIPAEILPFKKSSNFRLKGKGEYKTANMVLFDSANIEDREFLESQIEKAFPMRRTTSPVSKVRLAWFLAKSYPKEIFKYYFLKNLTEKDVESAFRRRPGLSFKLIETTDPRALIDIDYGADYDFIQQNYEQISRMCPQYQ